MSKEVLGTVIESDVLVIGGGCAGLSSAISAKEAHPELDVVVVERNTIGYAGLATKSGHGWVDLVPGLHDVEKYVEHLVHTNGDFLNDQDFLRWYGSTIHESVLKAHGWGVQIPYNEDGTFQSFPHPLGAWANIAIPLNIMKTLQTKAAEAGVKLMSRIHIADLIKDGDRLAAAIGFTLDEGTFLTFKAKSFVLATGGCHYGVEGWFTGYNDGIAMTYRAGAEMRNAEFGVASDFCYSNDGEPIYGGFPLCCNKDGENVYEKYTPGAHETSLMLALGMEQEMDEGRGPLYCDLGGNRDLLKVIGGVGNEGEEPGIVDGKRRLWPDAVAWQAKVAEKAEKYRVVTDEDPDKPLVTMKLSPECCPVRVDRNYKTTLPNLWSAGNVCYAGSAYFGWVRGDGVGNALHTGMWAGPNAAEGAIGQEFANIDLAQLEEKKAAFLAPMERKGGMSPRDMFDKITDIVVNPKYIMHKTEASMTEALEMIADLKADVPKLYGEDIHMLAKCREMEALLTIAEMFFRSSLVRTESRGCHWRHYRDDYPERDDKNWLKWICLKNVDGEMKLWTEDVPIESYKYRPEGM